MIRMLINIYCVLLFVEAIIAFVPAWKNMQWRLFLKSIADWGLKPIRKNLPPWVLSEKVHIDLSPIAFFIITRIVFFLW